MKRKGGMQGISFVLPRVYPAQSPVDRAVMGIFSQWCRSVPERVYTHAQPVRLRAGTLTVHVKTAAWANVLQLENDSLLASLRARYPHCGVQRIVFRVGPLPDLPLPKKEPPVPKVVPLKEVPEPVAMQLVRIRSDALRDAVARAVAVGLGDRKFSQE